MCTFAAIGINNNFSSCQTRVAMRPTNDKFSCRIHVIDDVIVEESQHLFAEFSLCSWNERVDDVGFYLCQHRFIIL